MECISEVAIELQSPSREEQMNASKIKSAVAATLLLGTVSAAQAGFVTVDSADPGQYTIDIVPSNQFRSTFAGIGVTTYTLGCLAGHRLGGLDRVLLLRQRGRLPEHLHRDQRLGHAHVRHGFHAEHAGLLRSERYLVRLAGRFRRSAEFQLLRVQRPRPKSGLLEQWPERSPGPPELAPSRSPSASAAAVTAPGSSGTIRAPARTTTMTTC